MSSYRCNLVNTLLTITAALLLSACQSDGSGPVGDSATATEAEASTRYAVGSSTFFIHDESRPYDAVGGVNAGVRSLITEIWYPVDRADLSNSSRHPTYGDYVFGDRDVHRRMMTETTFFHLTPDTVREGIDQAQIDAAIEELFQRERASYVDEPMAQTGQRLPIIVVSHGDAGSRYNMESASEYLAGQGYFVIAADHTGNSPYAMTGRDPALAPNSGDPAFRAAMQEVLPLLDDHGVYGEEKSYGQSFTPMGDGFSPQGFGELDKALLQRVNDLRAVLSRLEAMNREGRFAGRLDLSRIGLMGRSFGGATTLAGLMLEDRFTSGFAVVPPSMPDIRPALPPAALIDPPQESAILASDGPFALNSLHKPTFLLSGGEDKLILGLGMQLAQATGAALPSAAHPYPVLEQTVAESQVPAALAVVRDTNHGSFGVSGPYWWPQLKPGEMPRFFDPEQSFNLLEAATAHRIQGDMALAFFNYTLRGERDGLATLKANPWQNQHTTLQLKGFD